MGSLKMGVPGKSENKGRDATEPDSRTKPVFGRKRKGEKSASERACVGGAMMREGGQSEAGRVKLPPVVQ